MKTLNHSEIEDQLTTLFVSLKGKAPDSFTMLPPSGSDRRYFRLQFGEETVIGVYNANIPENKAFIGFTQHFFKKNIPVPEILAVSEDKLTYLINDLGDKVLLDEVLKTKKDGQVTPEIIEIYKKVIRQLVNIQVNGGEGLDYSLCFQRASFDKTSIIRDLNAFKYYFLNLSGLPFNEEALDEDFNTLTSALLEINMDHFMFRDFQARNIMLVDDEPYFIDYQAGRKGPLQYDLASLLFQARASLGHEVREKLLEFYIETAGKLVEIDPVRFRQDYYACVLIRSIQVLATYGLRGLHEKKAHFLKSIPFALENVTWLLSEKTFAFKIPVLQKLLFELKAYFLSENVNKDAGNQSEGLTVSVFSFSYKNGIPVDESGHGGGFIFDCRAIHNPGRYQPYKQMTGRDEPVINFLLEKSEIKTFIEQAVLMVRPSVETYLERGFNSLSVGFGCTGGRHRSVYAADQLAEYLEEHFPVRVNLRHLQREIEGW